MFTIAAQGRPAREEMCHSSMGFCVAERPMRVGPSANSVEPLQREGQMCAALVVGHGVNFVDDHGFHVSRMPRLLSAVSRM